MENETEKGNEHGDIRSPCASLQHGGDTQWL